MKARSHTVWHAGGATNGRRGNDDDRPDTVAIWIVIVLTVVFWVGVVHAVANLF